MCVCVCVLIWTFNTPAKYFRINLNCWWVVSKRLHVRGYFFGAPCRQIGLASHWPRVTDISGGDLRAQGLGEGDEHPPTLSYWSMVNFTFLPFPVGKWPQCPSWCCQLLVWLIMGIKSRVCQVRFPVLDIELWLPCLQCKRWQCVNFTHIVESCYAWFGYIRKSTRGSYWDHDQTRHPTQVCICSSFCSVIAKKWLI